MNTILKYQPTLNFFIMDKPNKSPENGCYARRAIAGLLAMLPFFVACEKNADTTSSVDIPASTSDTPTTSVKSMPIASVKPVESVKAAETASKPQIKPEVKRVKSAKKEEKREGYVELKGNPSEIGPTVFLGDSLTVKLGEWGGKFNIEDTMVVAKIGQQTSWLLGQAQDLARSGKLGRFENAVVLIGSNDMGNRSRVFTAEAIFGRIEKIYSTLLGDSDYDGKSDFNGVDRVYGATIPPFKGKNVLSEDEEGFDEEKFDEINTKRLRINELIKGSKLPFRVIDIATTLNKGGIADNEDPDRISLIGPNNKTYKIRDGMHCPKIYMRLIYERELRKDTN